MPVDERVEAAMDRFDADSREVRILRLLAEEPGETLPQSSLVAAQEVGDATVSLALGELEEIDLVERYSVGRNNHVELLPAGSAYLDALDAELDQQTTLDRLFNGTGHSPNRPCIPAHGNAPGDGQTDQQPQAAGPYRTRYLKRPMHTATVATGDTGGVTVLEAPLPDADDVDERRTRWVSYDDDREEAVVAVRAAGALQYVVSIALSLASPRFIDEALPDHRLENIDLDAAAIRYLRCIGGYSEEAEEDAQELRDNLVDWGERLADMTRDLRHGEYDDRDRFRGEIMRSAHGLAGSIVHLLDAAGIDYHRELRLAPSLGHEKLDAIRTTIIREAQIQSHYNDHTIYRQLYENRADKLGQSPIVDVDADDPFGEYVGSLTIRGPDAGYLGNHLEGFVRGSRLSGREDAPEIAVRIPVSTAGRSAYAETVSRMCSLKNIRSTSEAVTLYRVIAASPHAVATAINWLGSEDRQRDLRLDEVRVSLARLEPEQLLLDAPPSVSKAIGTLLRSTQSLTQSELAEAADVSARSLRRHLDALVALDLVREEEGGYRFVLPFATDEERGDHVLPTAVGDTIVATQDLLFDVVEAFVDDPGRLGDPEDPLYRAFQGFPPDLAALRTELPDIGPWVRVARILSDAQDPEAVTVEFGSRPDRGQVSLQTAVNGGVAADD